MNVSNLINRLEFDDKPAANKQVNHAFTDYEPFVVQLDAHLTLKWNASKLELIAERVFVVVLAVSWPQVLVNLDGGTQDILSQLFSSRVSAVECHGFLLFALSRFRG
jgi:hypothetical protein